MRPILWRHWLTGAVLFGLASLLTLAPSGGVVAMAFMPREDPAELLADEAPAREDAWQSISIAPPAVEEPRPADPIEPSGAREAAAEAPPVAPGPKKVAAVVEPTRAVTARAAQRASRTGGEPQVATLRAAKKDTKCLDPDPRIREVSPGRFEVDRALVVSLTDLEELQKQGYASVHTGDDGKSDGFRIGGLKCGNYLHQAGFRRGDVVQAVNGKPTRNALQAWAAYLSERDSDVLRVDIVRKGTRQTLVYRLV
jgi:hypothetical protein